MIVNIAYMIVALIVAEIITVDIYRNGRHAIEAGFAGVIMGAFWPAAMLGVFIGWLGMVLWTITLWIITYPHWSKR